MSRNWWVLAAVACGTFMATLDSSIVNIALPTLRRAFATELIYAKWVVTAYFFIITCLLLPVGRLSDHYGHKFIFSLGFFVFTVGSFLCGLSQSLGWLVGSRVVQASGAAMLMANGPAIIASTFAPNRLGTALGILAMSVSIGLISGPAIGGLLIVGLGWRSIFLINVPIGFIGLWLVYKFVRADVPKKKKLEFDWVGAVLQSLILVLFIELFEFLNFSGSRPILIFLICVLLPIFYLVETRAKAPLIDFSLLRNRTFWTANLAAFLTFVSYYSIAILIPFFLEDILKYPTDVTGQLMTAIPLMMFVFAPLSGRLSDRFGSKELCVIGAMVSAITFLVMGGAIGPGLTQETSKWGVAAGLCAMGLGIGLFQSPNNNAIMGVVPKAKLGVASALIATVRNLGLVTGAGLATGLFSWQFDMTDNYMVSLRFTLIVAGIVALAAVAASFGKETGPHWRS